LKGLGDEEERRKEAARRPDMPVPMMAMVIWGWEAGGLGDGEDGVGCGMVWWVTGRWIRGLGVMSWFGNVDWGRWRGIGA
jgi:hypothetical protein